MTRPIAPGLDTSVRGALPFLLALTVATWVPAIARAQGGATESRVVELRQIGAERPVHLRGTEQKVEFPVSVRNDEVVTRARLKLRYAHSPALIFEWSHLAVLIDDEVVANVRFDASTADGAQKVIDLDPRRLTGYRRLGLRTVMHYTRECEDPSHSALWAMVADDSVLELDVRRTPPAHDLALLPEPFFDPRDPRALELTFVLPPDPSADELQAAGVVASWFGALAGYRGARFPVQYGRVPDQGNAVMLATLARLAVDVDLPRACGAQLAVADNPSDRNGRLLVVTGDDGASLVAAARALSLGTPALSGPSASVRGMAEPPPRAPYDAPRWVPTDRVVRIGEHVDTEHLQVRGRFPPPIRVRLNLPPDLFSWQGKGARFEIGHRYTPTAGPKSTLDLDINGRFTRAVPLPMIPAPGRDGAGTAGEDAVPETSRRETYFVPLYKFASANELAWQYRFGMPNKGTCGDVAEEELRGSIDADSTVDLRSLPHFTHLPDLGLFVDGAFPFSKYADLSQTVAVLPTRPSEREVGTFLDVMRHIGDATGFPATRLRVLDSGTVKTMGADADLLVFGTPASQPLLAEWAEHMPVTSDRDGTQLQVIGPADRLRARFSGRDLEGARAYASRMIVEAGRNLGALMSFESPLTRARTVVVFAAADDARLPELSALLDDPARSPFVGGDLTLLNGTQVSSYELAPQYAVGSLPFFLGIRWWFARQPLLLALLAIVLSGLVALLLHRAMRNRALLRHGGP